MVRMSGYKKTLGAWGENVAATYLSQRGYRIVERNYTCPLGEIDIIAHDEENGLVFVEVRSNSTAHAGLAEVSIGYRKQRKLRQVATYYLKVKGMLDCPCRFDVVIVLLQPETGETHQIKLIKNAIQG